MDASKREFFPRLAVLAGTAQIAPSAFAQDYPSRPVKIICAYAPGGGNDMLARVVAERLTARWGGAVIVENKPGAGGAIGAAAVRGAKPDGYTLLVASVSNIVISKALNPAVPYEPTDFAPITVAAAVPVVLVVHTSSPFNSVAELIAYAQANPGRLNYSSGGVGTGLHLAGALFTQTTRTDIAHIPYNGDGQAITALLAKDVSLMFAALPSVASRIASGEFKALAVAQPKRLASMPNLPTTGEAGVGGNGVLLWHGFLAPKGIPKDVMDKVHDSFAAVLHEPEVRTRLQELGFEMIAGTPAEMAATIQADAQKWPAVIAASGATTR